MHNFEPFTFMVKSINLVLQTPQGIWSLGSYYDFVY